MGLCEGRERGAGERGAGGEATRVFITDLRSAPPARGHHGSTVRHGTLDPDHLRALSNSRRMLPALVLAATAFQSPSLLPTTSRSHVAMSGIVKQERQWERKGGFWSDPAYLAKIEAEGSCVQQS